VGDRDRPRGHRAAAAAAGAARGALGVPRVAGRAEAARLGHRQDPELRRLRAAHEHEARLAEPPGHRGVVVGHEVRGDVAALGQLHALDRQEQVLEAQRHAGERALVARLDGVGRGQRPLGVHQRPVVQVLGGLDPVKRGLRQLARGDLPAADHLREFEGGLAQ
jgi:hypothetical protein